MIQDFEQNKTHKQNMGRAKLLLVTSDHGEVLNSMNLFKPLDTTCKRPKRIGYIQAS